ncbi:hypothetical protein F2Q69_00010157 [Brassica cretica]|uniref:F-box associated beta-propeller type 1 domain-containing protein n=1 Tax=Brassica cretica TaxID=69181 RepID=A0A8S9P753_BRACR|nr:hypothetical protein F2Q69_00010157 [Brassica cretica]
MLGGMLLPSAPYRVVGVADPVFVDGSLHWFTDCKETKILCFDLHTEAFQVISKAPFPNSHHNHITWSDKESFICDTHKGLSTCHR